MRAISSTFKSGLGPDCKGLGPVDGGKVNAGRETRDLEQLHQAVLLFRAKRLIEGEQMH